VNDLVNAADMSHSPSRDMTTELVPVNQTARDKPEVVDSVLNEAGHALEDMPVDIL
jgi:hypothetical protein